MPRFFTDEIIGDTAFISGEDAVHISRVLRMKTGEAITVCDLQGFDYLCHISGFETNRVTLAIQSKAPNTTEPSVEITLYQAMPKLDKMELIIQKAVELGAARIVPVLTARCISRPDEKTMHKKSERYNKIAFEAAKQSGRGKLPQVLPLVSFSEALQAMKQSEISLLFYEKAQTPLAQLLPKVYQSAAVMVGSEGGFEEKEAEQAKAMGISLASLGARILRCETAPLAALSAILFQSGNF